MCGILGLLLHRAMPGLLLCEHGPKKRSKQCKDAVKRKKAPNLKSDANGVTDEKSLDEDLYSLILKTEEPSRKDVC